MRWTAAAVRSSYCQRSPRSARTAGWNLLVSGAGADQSIHNLLPSKNGLDNGVHFSCRSVSLSYPVVMGAMRGITIKLPESTVLQQARQSGRSVAAIVRELIDAPPHGVGSVYDVTADLAGSLAGGRTPGDERPAQVPATTITICDTGPLLAYLSQSQRCASRLGCRAHETSAGSNARLRSRTH